MAGPEALAETKLAEGEQIWRRGAGVFEMLLENTSKSAVYIGSRMTATVWPLPLFPRVFVL